MKEFMKYNFNLKNISWVCYVPEGAGAPNHKNRYSNGLVFQTKGNLFYRFDTGMSLNVSPNVIYYLPKGTNYNIKDALSGACYVINFDFDGDAFLPFLYKPKNPASMLDFFKRANISWKTKSPGYEMQVKAEFYGLIAALQKEYNSQYLDSKHSGILAPAISEIHEKYTSSSPDISQLAGMCGISETYFRRIFQRKYGVSPLKYINGLKIQRARELIATGMYSIHSISELSGFKNECYFSREFKKHTGISPSEYRKNVQP